MEDKIRVRKIKHQDLTNYLISKDGRIFNSKGNELANTITNGYYIVKIKKNLMLFIA
jgi:hypothetical protein